MARDEAGLLGGKNGDEGRFFFRGAGSADGREAAKKRGRVGGRPLGLSAAQRVEVRRMRDEEGRRVSEIAQLFRVSVKTVRRA